MHLLSYLCSAHVSHNKIGGERIETSLYAFFVPIGSLMSFRNLIVKFNFKMAECHYLLRY